MSSRLLKHCHDIADLREAAKRRLPRLFFDYVDGGSHSETTMRWNVTDYERWRLMPRALRDAASIDLTSKFLGKRHALPFMLGPVGYLGMLCRRGDITATRAANNAGIPSSVATFSIAALEDIAAACDRNAAFQLYVFRDRALSQDLLARAWASGLRSLIITVDTPITPTRPRDARNGFRKMVRLSPNHLVDMALHPGWSCDMLQYGGIEVANLARYGMGSGILEQSGRIAAAIDPSLNWSDLAWLRAQWNGHLYVKGILSAQDARACQDQGADGIIVSNHGGRQLDFAPSSISCLPRVRAAVDDDFEVLFDGGIRRGSDVAIALALGANAVLLGRAYAWGLAGFGEAGVAAAIQILANELASTLTLMGITSVDALRMAAPEQLMAVSRAGQNQDV